MPLYQQEQRREQGGVSTPLRFGILGAARIAPNALIKPARQVGGVEVKAVAARSPVRAKSFAARYGIARAYASYSELLADDTVDAVYIALPNSLHAEWSIRALEAGKHVLCEKPMSSNAAEAGQVADAASRCGRVYAEAFHNLYHPLAFAMREWVQGGALGPLRSVRGVFNTTILRREDIRFEYELGGGALMDLGCYLISLTRFVLASDLAVESAECLLLKANVDASTDVSLRVVNLSNTSANPTIHLQCAMQRWGAPQLTFEVVGERGTMKVINPILPQLFNRMAIEVDGVRQVRYLPRVSTYACQLRAFVSAVHGGSPIHTDALWGRGTMQVIDAIYEAAGLPVRGLARP